MILLHEHNYCHRSRRLSYWQDIVDVMLIMTSRQYPVNKSSFWAVILVKPVLTSFWATDLVATISRYRHSLSRSLGDERHRDYGIVCPVQSQHYLDNWRRSPFWITSPTPSIWIMQTVKEWKVKRITKTYYPPSLTIIILPGPAKRVAKLKSRCKSVT